MRGVPGNGVNPELVALGMRLIADTYRPALVTAGLLTAFALAPWSVDSRSVPPTIVELEPGDALHALGPLTIDIPNEPSRNVPNLFDSWEFADMRPWPAGMVIHPRPTDDYAVLRRTGNVYSLLSGLLTRLFGADA